jgi:selenocysteine lyase/cysteine desulfurase
MMKTLFEVNADGYFLSHSVGLQPKSAKEALYNAMLAPWAQDPEQVWPHWLEEIQSFRTALAKLLNTQSDLICPQVNLSSAYTKILQALPFDKQRPVILMSERDFPSMVFVATQAQRLGYQLRLLDKSFDVHDTQAWQEAFTADVALVMLSHVYSNSGCRLDIAPICEIARAANVLSVVDIAQSVGVMPIDCQSWQADFILGSCVKWLCGGPGAGFLWVSQDSLSRCEPVDVGWFSHENPFEFDVKSFRYHESALRFWGGTPSVLPYCLAANSIENTLSIGLDNIYAHNRKLSQRLWLALEQQHLVSPECETRSGGTSIINMKDGQTSFMQRLKQAGIAFDQRLEGIRISPHIYNTDQDLDKLINCL